MATIFVILVLLVALVLGFLVLVQNPKGGGLAGNVGGLSNQLMGVKQTTDVLEKGTWIFAGVIGLLCLFSSIFIGKSPYRPASSNARQATEKSTGTQGQQQPAQGQGQAPAK
jgi:preprotein translocase subunit SecG